jgi:hypothetical protein
MQPSFGRPGFSGNVATAQYEHCTMTATGKE